MSETRTVTSEPEAKAAGAMKQGRRMTDNRNQKFFERANLRITFIQAVIMAVIGVITIYTTNLVNQNALAQRVENMETLMRERKTMFDEMKNDAVTKEILELKLKPIVDEQKRQGILLDRIAAAVTRPVPNPFYTPSPDP